MTMQNTKFGYNHKLGIVSIIDDESNYEEVNNLTFLSIVDGYIESDKDVYTNVTRKDIFVALVELHNKDYKVQADTINGVHIIDDFENGVEILIHGDFIKSLNTIGQNEVIGSIISSRILLKLNQEYGVR
jgi:hypothetical protein